LHPMEFKLLQFLLSHPNQVFNAHALFQRVWQKDLGLTEDTVRTHIRTLRQKIDTKNCPSVIVTVRGHGYKTEKYIAIADSASWGFQAIDK
jgi:two-component system phosphate regulon response regulator PhoB